MSQPGPHAKDYRPTFAAPVTDWWRWFAWRPVGTVDRGWRWLRPVWRRRVQKHGFLGGGGRDFWWQHAVASPMSSRGAER